MRERPLQNRNGLATGTAPRCTLQALAKVVPGGTAGAIPLNDGSGNSGLIALQNPLPESKQPLTERPSKSSRVSPGLESREGSEPDRDKSLQFRLEQRSEPRATQRAELGDQHVNHSVWPDYRQGWNESYDATQLRLQF